MKTSNLTTRIAMAVLLLAVLFYFGLNIYSAYAGGMATVLAYTDAVSVGVEATGLLVREEQVLTVPQGASGALVDLAPDEGEKVAKGDVVATLYASAQGLETKRAIRTLEAEVEQLEYALQSTASTQDSAKVESKLLESIAGLHASASSGDLTGLEADALQLRTLVFRRDFTMGDDRAAQQLQSLIQEKTARLGELRASLGSASTVVRAPCPGIFSGAADGYESLITPASLTEITAPELDALLRGPVSAPADAVGSLTTSSTWYFAAPVSAEDAARLREGERYRIAFSRDYAGEIPMTLERISDTRDGRAALIFSSRTNLAELTLLRRQTVDIVTDRIVGVRVPRTALRALEQRVTRTRTNEETGETETYEEDTVVTGLYRVVSRQAEFTPVNVLYQGSDYFLVEPVDQESPKRLRAGDEIIVSTVGVTDGKVVR